MKPYRILFDNRNPINKIDVSIVVPVFGCFDLLSLLIESILKFKPSVKIELVLIDDHSSEDIIDIIQKYKNNFYGVVIKNEKNVGYAISCNHGTKEASGKFLLFTNTDIQIIHNSWLEPMLDAICHNKNAGTISPILLYSDQKTIQYAGSFFCQGDYEDNSFDHKHYYKHYPIETLPNNSYYTESLSGACFMIETKIFKKIGGFDPQFHTGYGFEDLDLAVRLAEHKLYNLVCPSSKLIHLESKSFGQNVHTSERKNDNRKIFFDKWKNLDPKKAYSAIQTLKTQKSWLIISHGLPPANVAGVEVYTYNLVREMAKHRDTTCLYALLSPEEKHHPTGKILFDREENGAKIYKVINRVEGYNFFSNHGRQANGLDVFYPDFIKLLYEIHPDVILFQHTNFMSVDMVKWAKKNTTAKIVYALNEFLPICANNGQLVTKKFELCTGAEKTKCFDCLKVIQMKDLAEREKIYRENLIDYTDYLIAPSEFLRQKYIEWGVSDKKIIYSDYGFVDYRVPKKLPNRYIKKKNLIFGFIGTITPFKGMEILLDAFQKEIPQISLEIHGICNDAILREKLLNACNKPWIRYNGPYAPDVVPLIVNRIDVLIVPSIWWENSPLVIHEARIMGIPVLVSDIGGMKELAERYGGVTFRRGDAEHLRHQIIELNKNRHVLFNIAQKNANIKTIKENVIELLELFQ